MSIPPATAFPHTHSGITFPLGIYTQLVGNHFTMKLPQASVLATLLLLPLTVTASTVGSPRSCKCQPSLPCWPSKSDWQKFNSTVGGMLIADIRPISSACYKGTPDYNKARCDEVTKNFGDGIWRADQAGKIPFLLYSLTLS